MRTTVFAILFVFSVAQAGEVSDCTQFQAPIPYDLNDFKFYSEINPQTGVEWFHYLGESIVFEISSVDPDIETWGVLRIFLMDNSPCHVKKTLLW